MASHVTGPLYVDGVAVGAGAIEPQGIVYYLDPKNGSDGNPGTKELPVASLEYAYGLLRDGYGDGIELMGYFDSTYGTARLSSAFEWAKSNCFLHGMCAPNGIAQRARIAQTSGSVIEALFTVSGQANRFQNLHIFHSRASNGKHIALTVTGDRNVFIDCHIAGIGVATTSTTSRSLLLTGADENRFVNCKFGLTTIDRTVANAEVEFASKCARNEFVECDFLSRCSGSGTGHGFITLAANSLQDYVKFVRCRGINAIWSSYGVAMAYAFLKSVADVNGLVWLEDCSWNATNLAADLTDVVATGRYDGTDLTTDLGIMVGPTNT